MKDPVLKELFENCLPNTLDTTVRYQETAGEQDTFIITGDINAMWRKLSPTNLISESIKRNIF